MKAVVEQDGDVLLIRIPMRLKKRGGRKEVIVPAGFEDGQSGSSAAQEPLVVALARAHHWRELLESGQYGSVTELALALDADRSYVARILRLTLLAPDIVEAIMRGDEPSGLSLARLVSGLPSSWGKQRAELARRVEGGRPGASSPSSQWR